jgi:hypothetical protein
MDLDAVLKNRVPDWIEGHEHAPDELAVVEEGTHSHEGGGRGKAHDEWCSRVVALLGPGRGQPTQGGADRTAGHGTAGAAGCLATGVLGAEQQGRCSARNSRGAGPPGGCSWTARGRWTRAGRARRVLRVSSLVLGAVSVSNAQRQGAVVAQGELLARRGFGRSARRLCWHRGATVGARGRRGRAGGAAQQGRGEMAARRALERADVARVVEAASRRGCRAAARLGLAGRLAWVSVGEDA